MRFVLFSPVLSCSLLALALALRAESDITSQVVEYRSQDPKKTEKEVAEWLVSVQERNPGLYGFWAELFPVCYNRTVESWS